MHRDIAEHMSTFGDLGSPASVIRANFPKASNLPPATCESIQVELAQWLAATRMYNGF